MFGDVMKFTQKKYFDGHVDGTVLTKDGREYRLKIFAVLETDAANSAVYSMREIHERTRLL